MAKVVKDAFKNVKRRRLSDPQTKIAGQSDLRRVAAMEVGSGSKSLKVDGSGLWLGAREFASAPFSVDMEGNVTASSANLSGSGYTKINIFKQNSIPTSIAVGDLWFDTNDNNKLYRAGGAGADEIKAGEWELVGTSTTVFAQASTPTSLNEGDIWFDTGNDNRPYRAASIGADQITAGEWEAVDDQRAADALLKAGTSQNLSGDIDVGTGNVKIDGGNKRIIINDGSNDRILMGYDPGGF